MLERVKEGDHNYISGLRKYIAAYKAMQRSHVGLSLLFSNNFQNNRQYWE